MHGDQTASDPPTQSLRNLETALADESTVSPLRAADMELGNAVATLEKQLSRLADRLDPVLTPIMEEPSDTKMLTEIQRPQAPAVSAIMFQASRITFLSGQIDELISRLAV